MEYVRAIQVVVEVDTNKATNRAVFDDFQAAAFHLFRRLDTEDRARVLLGICRRCLEDVPDEGPCVCGRGK